MIGRLSSKDATLGNVQKLIDSGKFLIIDHNTLLKKVGERTSWDYDEQIKIKTLKSPYMQRFRQGAIFSPPMFWFVDIIAHSKFGMDMKEPFVRSSRRSIQMAKKEYKNIVVNGKVEEDYLYATLLGSDLLPFCNLPYRIVVLPIYLSSNSYYVLNKEIVHARGHNNMFQWLGKGEDLWFQVRKEKTSKMNILSDTRSQ